ncbi:MAG TPA: hypothetical protein VHL58_04265 [Thermoanaerobaculia bacterium]|nr:hypothetical protein [Thermoanaerobaculia bacterium]
MTDEDLKSLLDAMREENAVAHTETRRHFDVGNEATRHEIRVVAESVAQVNEKLDREAADIRDEVRRGFAETQAMIKFSHDELHRRVRALEESQRTVDETLADLRARVEHLEDSTH